MPARADLCYAKLSVVKEIEKSFQAASVGFEPVSTQFPITLSNLRAIASMRVVRENNIVQSDLSDSSTKLSMFIWAMFGVLVSRFV